MGQSFRDVPAWQHAMQLVNTVYAFTRSFPAEEQNGLTSQVRRTAVSVPSNIAAGQALPQKEFLHCLSTARGSLAELQTQALIAVDLGFVAAGAAAALIEETNRVDQMVEALYSTVDVGWNRSSL
ncbi:MAG TPA: four helix bundle protein [Clostridia bacterium]|nr:four helix bundle protein [Clostridia bacterium]